MQAKAVKSGKKDISVSLSDQMYCYCQQKTGSGEEFWLANEVVKEVQEFDHTDQTNYCWIYIREIFFYTFISEGSAAITALINSAIALIFGFLGHYLVKHTTIETQVQSYTYILVLEYMNMGIIKLFQVFDPSGLLKDLSGDKNKYNGFDSKFY